MKKKNIVLASAFLVSSLFTVYSCSKSGSSNNTTQPPTGTTAAISMKDMAFVPATITVAKGTVVTWTNNDGYGHTVVSKDGTTIPLSSNISGGGTYSYTANTPGTIPYYCTIHGTVMSGTLIVNP